MLHYYLNLYKGNINRALAVKRIAQNQFTQFEQFLQNSIKALKKKEISAEWEPVITKNLAKLQIIGNLFQYNKQTVIRINGNRKGYYRIILKKGAANFSKRIEYQIGDKEGETEISEDDYKRGTVYIEGVEAAKFDALRWGFADIELTPAWFSISENEMLHDSGGKEYKIISVSGDDVTVMGVLPADKKLFYGETEISFNVIKKAELPYKDIENLRETENEIIFYAKPNQSFPEEIRRVNNLVKDFMDFSKILFCDNPKKLFEFSKREDDDEMIIILHDRSDYNKKVISNKIFFDVLEIGDKDSEHWKIQLKEPNNEKDSEEELNALSPLRYFFDENVTITEYKNKKNKFIVDKYGCDSKEYQIVLRREQTEDEKNNKIFRTPSFKPFCHPPEGSKLQVQVDTRPLERQLGAVRILMQMPHRDQEMLIRLFEQKDVTKWALPSRKVMIDDDKWLVLTDENRSGCFEQREFVTRALNTPDFAILEGPPGSGKTTVILELICQLILRKDRVLLCGSTNVAIDNVLERLIEKKGNEPSLMDRIRESGDNDLLPVRIGKAEKVDPNIVKYQIDKLTGEDTAEDKNILDLKQSLLLDAANLVCGTTNGIANHPKFRNQVNINNTDTPVVPEFDFLIIDESSKTTFHEFLVPALYAKRWILAGDVMQLSPFTDTESVEYNFEKIYVKNNAGTNELLDINIQNAVFYIDKLKQYNYWFNKEDGTKGNNNFILPCSGELMERIVEELSAGRIGQFKYDELFMFIADNTDKMESVKKFYYDKSENEQIKEQINKQIILLTTDNANPLELTAANFLLYERAVKKKIKKKRPVTHALLQTKRWEATRHAFCHNVFQQKGSFGYYMYGKMLKNSFKIVDEINKELSERSWAQEIAWRINSEHQLRLAKMSKRRDEKLGPEIDKLTPCSVNKENFEEARNILTAMNFPSILESLRIGIKGKKPKDPSTISDGFEENVLRERNITLIFQHRMHPDISSFPRERYYDSNALLDLKKPEHILDARQWDYTAKYGNRSMWIDVKGPARNSRNFRGSRNIYEVEAMMSHLKDFLEYAVKNPQPEGKDWNVACLAFYRGQEQLIREGGDKYMLKEIKKGDKYTGNEIIKIEGMRAIPGIEGAVSTFIYNKNKSLGPNKVFIRLHSVDRFQGHEADVVFLSMSRTDRDGFLDNPNRLNVAITRAKFQLLIFGKYEYFSKFSRSEDLKALALRHEQSKLEWRQE